jgi:Na+-translocating ferredoxin:NAD+ oxidoreductase RnfC subunit
MSKMSRNEGIIDAIRNSGVVGAGGAGFPTHVKLAAKVDVIIANGAECEPLLASDQAVMISTPEKVVAGLKAAMEATGAGRGYIGVKKKHVTSVAAIEDVISGYDDIDLVELEDIYPIGDEHVLTYEVTGRYVPEGGLPLEAGVVVSNVATLANIADALEGRPVTHRTVTVVGEVERPITVSTPVGTAIEELVRLAGGPDNEDCEILLGGPMMGKLASLKEAVVTKLTGGVIVLSKNHVLIRQRSDSLSSILRRARSSCCQCMTCTETCPRNLLGHQISPHLIMRAVSMNPGNVMPEIIKRAWLCSECGVCETITCPSGLSPVRVNQALKESMMRKGIKNPYHRSDIAANPMREYRKVPGSRLNMRAGISKYSRQPADILQAFDPDKKMKAIPVIVPERVDIPLLQHVGAPAVPCVKQGDAVNEGDLIAEIPDSALGARIHASIPGVVLDIGKTITIVARGH